MKKNKLHTIRDTGYKIPDNYFDSFENKVLSQIKVNNIESSGFNTPDNYFEGLEDKILSQAKISHIEKTGFKTPSTYFITLEDSILSNLSSEKKTTKVISLFTKKNIVYISSIAAAVLLLLNSSIFDNKIDFDSLESGTVENYIINEDITSLEIASLLTKGELIEENFIDYDLSKENIENYILNNVDIEDIIIE